MARSRCGAAAGHQLGLSKVVIRGRLERARERLRVRLTRRGVTAPAGLLVAGAAAEARAAIPLALTHSTIRIGSGFVANHTAAVLARGVLKSMLLNQVKVPALLVCLLGAIAICLAEARPPASARSPVPVDDDAAAGRLVPAGPFPIDLAFSHRRPGTDYEKVAVSPTGKSIAYGVITPQRGTRRSVDAPVGTADPIHRDPPKPGRCRHRQVVPAGGRGNRRASPRHGHRTARSSPTTPTRGARSAPGSTMWPGERPASRPTVRIKAQLITTTVMPPAWSPDGRQLLVPALPADEAHADPRPPRGRPVTGKGRPRAGNGRPCLPERRRAGPARRDPDGGVQQLRVAGGPDGHRHQERHHTRAAPGEIARPTRARRSPDILRPAASSRTSPARDRPRRDGR